MACHQFIIIIDKIKAFWKSILQNNDFQPVIGNKDILKLLPLVDKWCILGSMYCIYLANSFNIQACHLWICAPLWALLTFSTLYRQMCKGLPSEDCGSSKAPCQLLTCGWTVPKDFDKNSHAIKHLWGISFSLIFC